MIINLYVLVLCLLKCNVIFNVEVIQYPHQVIRSLNTFENVNPQYRDFITWSS